MNQTTQISLLHRLRSQHDTAAWSKFVELYTPLVHRWISDLGVRGHECNDVVQEVFIALLGRISTFQYDAKKSFRGWLRTVTLNKTRDLLRKQKRAYEPVLRERLEIAQRDEAALLTEQEYREHVAASALKLMQQHFSKTTWQACWAHVAEGRAAPEVAQELGISVNAVYLARGRVLRRLREELTGLWED